MYCHTPVKPPTSIKERAALSTDAGLGDSVITFNVDGDSSHCHARIIETFSKLTTTGYELLLYDIAGENSSFCPLKPPYIPRKLKEVVGQCGQDLLYIKPSQKDLIVQDSGEDTSYVS